MGSSASKTVQPFTPPSDTSSHSPTSLPKDVLVPLEAPPAMHRIQSFDEKLYDKKRDPMRAQKMMRARVGAQFATLATFVYYVGFQNVNFDVAPAYYRTKEMEAKAKQNETGERV